MTDLLVPDIDFALDAVPNLHSLIDELRPQGPVVRVKYLREPVWLINTYAELRQAFSDEEHFASAAAYKIHSEPSMGKTMQTMGGEEHRINRALVSRSFFPREVRSQIEPLIVPQAHALLDRIEGLAEVDMVEAFSRPYPFTIITRMLGIPVLDDEKFLHWAIKIPAPVVNRLELRKISVSHYSRIDKAKRDFGWTPPVSFDEAVERCLPSCVSQHSGPGPVQ